MLSEEIKNTKAAPENKNPAAGSANFRLFLQNQLAQRCRENPQYSLRAFARFLKVEPSRLSKILRGERPVGALLLPMAQRLGVSPIEIERFKRAAIAEKLGIAAELIEDNHSQKSYLELSFDVFETVADFYHYAILELMKLKNFKPEEKWIAKALMISVPEVRACVSRLQRVGLLEILENGQWHDRSEGFSTHALHDKQNTTYAHKKAQEQILTHAMQALDKTAVDRRDQSSVMMATSREKIAEAKNRIKKFRRELCEFLEEGETKDAIYQLSVSLFPLAEDLENS